MTRVYSDDDSNVESTPGLNEAGCRHFFGSGATLSTKGQYCICKPEAYAVLSNTYCRKNIAEIALCQFLWLRIGFHYFRLPDWRNDRWYQGQSKLSSQCGNIRFRKNIIYFSLVYKSFLDRLRVLGPVSVNQIITSRATIEHAVSRWKIHGKSYFLLFFFQLVGIPLKGASTPSASTSCQNYTNENCVEQYGEFAFCHNENCYCNRQFSFINSDNKCGRSRKDNSFQPDKRNFSL